MEAMQVRVRWNQMLQSAEEREQIKRELNICASELAQIRSRLGGLSSLKLQIRRIGQLEEQIQIQAQQEILFANTVVNLCGLYKRNENRLVDYSDAVGRMARRESFLNQNLTELNQVFQKVLL